MASVIRGSDNFDSGAEAITLGTEVATTSGTSIDFTGIPAGVKRITVMFKGVSTNSTSNLLVQLGDSGGVETSSYVGSTSITTTGANAINFSTGFLISQQRQAGWADHGIMTILLMDSATNTWVNSSSVGIVGIAGTQQGSGSKSLSATLDRIRLTTVNGTSTFDAGSINISYE